jgi:hypothetical protein
MQSAEIEMAISTSDSDNVAIPADALRTLVSAAGSLAERYEQLLGGPYGASAPFYAERLVTISAAIRIAERALAEDVGD